MAGRRSRQGDSNKHEVDLNRQWAALKLPNLLETGIYDQSGSVLSKLVVSLEGDLEYECQHFHMVPCRANLLSLLYMKTKKYSEAEEINKMVRHREEDNLVARHVAFKLKCARKMYSEAEEILSTVQTLESSHKDVLVKLALAEQACVLESMGPAYYHKAARLFESALGVDVFSGHVQVDSCLCRQYPRHYLAYGYELALTYSRLFNQDNFFAFCDNQNGENMCFDVDNYFGMTITLFTTIISTYEKNFALKESEETLVVDGDDTALVLDGDLDWLQMLAARSWVDMGMAYSKYELKGKPSDRKCQLPRSLSPEQCMQNGLSTANDTDAHVLETAGRFFRQRSRQMKDLNFAIELLEKTVEISPKRHVAFHQMGLAHRSAWMKANKFSEDQVITNSRRTSSKKSKRNRKPNNENCFTAVNENVASTNLRGGATVGAKANAGRSFSEPCVEPLEAGPNYHRSCSTPAAVETIHPRTPPDVGEVPKLEQNLGFFQDKKSKNPLLLADGKGNDEHLEQARMCLARACELTHNTRARYLIDLARIHISLRNSEQAIECFTSADEVEQVNNTDKCYLYEQWALHVSEQTTGCIAADKKQDIKELFLDAVHFAVAACKKSLAFYHLKEIIESELKQDENNVVAKREMAVLFTLVKLHEKAEPILKKLIEENPEDVDSMWELVLLFDDMGNKNSAFVYLHSINALFQRSRIPQESFPRDWKKIASRVCLEACKVRTKSTHGILSTLFDIALPNDPREKHVMMVADDADSRPVRVLLALLRRVCSLNVQLACVDGSDDLDPGESLPAAFENSYDMSRTVVFFGADVMEAGLIRRFISGLSCSQRVVPACCVMTEGVSHDDLPDFITRSPSFPMATMTVPDAVADMVGAPWDVLCDTVSSYKEALWPTVEEVLSALLEDPLV